jgi:hypothetical protein
MLKRQFLWGLSIGVGVLAINAPRQRSSAMCHAVVIATVLCLLPGSASGQPSPAGDSFLGHLAGSWVLRGTIDGKATVHDVRAEWVLNQLYLQIHERSREKDARGQAEYEAHVLIGLDPAKAEYQCLWIDSTGPGGLTPQAIGHGKRSGDAIPFLFRDPDGTVSFNNTFSYEKNNDAWTWQMNNIQKGKPVPFGRVRLTRR